MLIQASGFNSPTYGNLGEVFTAYIYTVRKHAHREPLRATLISSAGEHIHEATAITVLKMILNRRNDGICYNCETDLTGNIPAKIVIRATCSSHFWWHGCEPKKFEDCYDWEKGYYDVYPHSDPHGTDFSRGTHMTTIVDRETGQIMKDKNGRNLAVYGYVAWGYLKDDAVELFEAGKAFDFCEDGVPHMKLAHCGPKGCIRQNPKTGKWKAAWE